MTGRRDRAARLGWAALIALLPLIVAACNQNGGRGY